MSRRVDNPGARELPGIATVGEVVSFGWRAVRMTRNALRYGEEILRQMALLATGSALVIAFVTFLAGQSCGLESAYLARGLGAAPLGPGASYACAVVYLVPFLFGFVLAAKVGCGMVAEIGAMRVRDEIDALDVLGIPSLAFLVAVRMIAASLVLPIIYWLAIGASAVGAYVQSAVRFRDVSPGTYDLYFNAFSSPLDLLLTFAQGMTISFAVMSVALYYGYTVRGGPVEVGVATARSMSVNLVLVTIINLAFVVLFLLQARVPLA